MKANLKLIVLMFSMSYSCYSQYTFLEKNREIFNEMQKETREIMSDLQTSISQMGFIEIHDQVEEKTTDEIVNIGEYPIIREMAANEYLPDIYPVSRESRLTSGYGYRTDPFTGNIAFHGAIDLAVPENTEVVSSGTGKIVKAGHNRINGNYIIIDHGNNYRSYYGHLSKLLVKANDDIKKGQVIGFSGNTGMSTGPHLHFQITFDGKTIDPLTIIN